MHGLIGIAKGVPMSRAGRKRKSGPRHPSGELIHTGRAPDDRIRSSRQPHRRNLPEPLRLDERAESALGRCNLRGQITDAQYDAGCMYETVVIAYRATIKGPRMMSGTCGRLYAPEGVVTEEASIAAFRCTTEECRLAMIEPNNWKEWKCGCEERRCRHQAARRALGLAGRRALIAVGAVVIDRQPAEYWPILYLIAGLDALARHFGIREERRN